jgi:hypothetical protein
MSIIHLSDVARGLEFSASEEAAAEGAVGHEANAELPAQHSSLCGYPWRIIFLSLKFQRHGNYGDVGSWRNC